MKPNHVWIIEMLFELTKGGSHWFPTVGCGIDREQAKSELKTWKRRNPCDKFRIRKYTSESK